MSEAFGDIGTRLHQNVELSSAVDAYRNRPASERWIHRPGSLQEAQGYYDKLESIVSGGQFYPDNPPLPLPPQGVSLEEHAVKLVLDARKRQLETDWEHSGKQNGLSLEQYAQQLLDREERAKKARLEAELQNQRSQPSRGLWRTILKR